MDRSDDEKLGHMRTPSSASQGSDPSTSSALGRSCNECTACRRTVEYQFSVDTCSHAFCLTCLRELSNIKASCPKCKQTFTRILHNISSDRDYNQCQVPSESWGQSQNLVCNRSSKEFRRHIYRYGLWVKQTNDKSYWIDCPESYRLFPENANRLIPWLKRELLALLSDNEDMASGVLKVVLKLIKKYNIRSLEFRNEIQPYLKERTWHFIHEFYNYSISSKPDMRSYDISTDYPPSGLLAERNANSLSLPLRNGAIVTAATFDASRSFSTLFDLPVSETVCSSIRHSGFSRWDQTNNVRKSSLPTSSLPPNKSSYNDAITSASRDQAVVSSGSTSRFRTSTTRTDGISRCSVLDSRISGSLSGDDDCVFLCAVNRKVLAAKNIVDLVNPSDDENTENDNSCRNNQATNQVVQSGGSSCKRKGVQESETATMERSQKKLRPKSEDPVNLPSETKATVQIEAIVDSVLCRTSPASDKGHIPEQKEFEESVTTTADQSNLKKRLHTGGCDSTSPNISRISNKASPEAQDHCTFLQSTSPTVKSSVENCELSGRSECIISDDNPSYHNVPDASHSHCYYSSPCFSGATRPQNSSDSERTRTSFSAEPNKECSSSLSLASSLRTHGPLNEESSKRHDPRGDDTSSSDESDTNVKVRSVAFRVHDSAQPKQPRDSKTYHRKHKHKQKKSKKHGRHKRSHSKKKHPKHSH